MSAVVALCLVLWAETPVAPAVEAPAGALDRALSELGRVEPLRIGASDGFTVAELFDSVRRHHPRQVMAEARLRAAEAERRAASGAYDPTLQGAFGTQPVGGYDTTTGLLGISQLTPLWGARLSGGYRISAGEVPPYYLERETLTDGELALGLHVPVLRDGPIDPARARLRTTQASLEQSEAERGGAELELLRDAAQLYFAWVATTRQYQVAWGLFELARRRDEQIRRQVEQGALADIERIDNVRMMLARRDAVLELERRIERAAIALSLYVRDGEGQPRVLGPERAPVAWAPAPLPKTPVEAAIAAARERRPELVALTAAQRRVGAELELAENRILPRLDLSLDLSKDLGRVELPRQEKLEPLALILGAKLELPVLLREGRGQRDAAAARLREQAAALRWAEDRVVQDVRDAHSALSIAARRVEVLELAALTAEQVAQAEWRRFELGSSSLINVNLREQAAAAARVSLIDAEAELRRAELVFALVICDPEIVRLEREMSGARPN